eukprot:CFRG2497T1
MSRQKMSLAERMASLLTAEPEREGGDDFDANDGGLDAHYSNDYTHSDEDENERIRKDTGMDVNAEMTHQRSALRKNAGMGMEDILMDPRYSGKKTSRANLNSNQSEDVTDSSDEDDELSTNQNDIVNHGENGVDSSGSSEEEDDKTSDIDEEELRLRKNLEKLEKEDESMEGISHFSASGKDRNVEATKGTHTRNLLSLCESVVESRIRLQQALNLCNSLPQPDTMPLMLERGGTELSDLMSSATKSTGLFVDSLLELQSLLLQKSGAEQLSKKRKRRPSVSDMDIDVLYAYTASVENDIADYRAQVLKSWHTKLLLSSSNASSKQLKSVNRDIATQVQQMMGDSDALVKRTQLKRVNIRPFGKIDNDEEKNGYDQIDKALREENYDAEIFDDNDFYHQILREFIAAKSRFSNDSTTDVGSAWVEMQSIKSKVKKRVDTKASKGRRIRYKVLPELVNFMFPAEVGTMNDSQRTELCKSLFNKNG